MKGSHARAIVAAAIIGAATIAGCSSGPTPSSHVATAYALVDFAAAQAATQSPAAPDAVVRYETVSTSTDVSDAGTSRASTTFVTATRTVTVYPSSAATVATVGDGPDVQKSVLQAGEFSFLPQGVTLTYQQAAALPGTSASLAATLNQHLQPYAGADPPSPFVLRQLGYLIVIAPMGPRARSAAWSVLGSVPGLHLCGVSTDLVGRSGTGLCADADGDETEILVDARTGTILAIEERLLQPSPLYPYVAPGTVVASDTFVSA